MPDYPALLMLLMTSIQHSTPTWLLNTLFFYYLNFFEGRIYPQFWLSRVKETIHLHN